MVPQKRELEQQHDWPQPDSGNNARHLRNGETKRDASTHWDIISAPERKDTRYNGAEP